jgi:multidrug resistance efflux pump
MHEASAPLDRQESGKNIVAADGDVERRKFIRKIVSLSAVVDAVVVTLYAWAIIERHPRTDDATVRANVVGIVPRVVGHTLPNS